MITLTPNSRLARFLRRSQPPSQTQKTQSLSSWIEQQYQTLLFLIPSPPRLLTAAQETPLWQSIISASPAGGMLLQAEMTAKTAMQAYQSLRHWLQPLDVLSSEDNPDMLAFASWATSFEQLCDAEHYLPRAALISFVSEHLNLLDLPTSLCLHSFDDVTPQMEALFTSMKARGVIVSHAEAAEHSATHQRYSAVNLDHEILSMARWTKARHEEDPTAQILCIVPNLTKTRPQVQQGFWQVFFPEARFSPTHQQDLLNISGGYPLANCPLIHAALTLLQLNSTRISCEQLSFILTTPFLTGYSDEKIERAQLDAQLRDQQNLQHPWPQVLEHATPQLQNQLQQWLQLRGGVKSQRLAQWQQTFYNLLQTLGWPGKNNLTSTQYQQMQRFYQVLQLELATLDVAQKKYSYQEAVKQLQRLCQTTMFEVESNDGPIQVLGMLEAAGIKADYCWVMHMDDETWPELAQPNPLLPYHLQRELSMPHSSANRELHYAQQMLQRLHTNCQHIIYSYHQHDADRQLVYSPLIATVTQVETIDQAPYQPLLESFTPIVQEHFSDLYAPTIGIDETVRGGTSIFKQQAACPFQAFAHLRLHATGLAEPDPMLNALERGLMLHACLDYIWGKLHSHQNLCGQADTQLIDLIDQSIQLACDEIAPHKLKPHFKTLEQQRLQSLLFDWLQHEKQRPAFKVVAHEQWRETRVGELTLNVQIDRIDELEGGSKMLIDYKTGSVNLTSWLGERPREPQLPLYALTETDIEAISFVQLRAGEMQFKGITAQDIDVPGVKPLSKMTRYAVPDTWSGLLSSWDDALQNLAEEFHHGYAAADPSYHDACSYCDLHALCRVGEK
jgi:probable DNA repair protein